VIEIMEIEKVNAAELPELRPRNSGANIMKEKSSSIVEWWNKNCCAGFEKTKKLIKKAN